MTPPLKRVVKNGDPMSHGGTVQAITTKTFVEGGLVVTEGAIYICPTHGAQTMVASQVRANAEGAPICRDGDSATCGATVTASSLKTFLGE